jgi:hypothetical protein
MRGLCHDDAVSNDPMTLRDAYDEQLRGSGEMHRAVAVSIDGPLVRGEFSEGRGFVSYRSLDGIEGARLDDLIVRTIAHYRDDTRVRAFEWKTRGHDAPADLPERLLAHGFIAEEPETVMIGEAAGLTTAPPLPAEVTLRRIDPTDSEGALRDVERMIAMQEAVFGRTAHDDAQTMARALIEDSFLSEAWIAEADGEVICTGRLALVPDTEFAGLWGGATRDDWRLRGVYRALCAARARSAIEKGVRYLHSDSTEGSRPILERSGFVAVTTTTPYIWERTTASGPTR